MKLIPLALLAIAVNLGARNPAQAAIRPRYGGTLRVGTQVALVSIDPNYAGQSNSVSLESMLPLVFDTLVKLDAGGQAQPWLASSWQAEPGNQRWVFKIQRGVTFADGSPLNADSVAASLRSSNSKWRVSPSADTVTVECDTPDPLLPAELAQARYGIVKRDKQLRGTGPFTVKEWIPGKKLTLVARDDYWHGSPFLYPV